MNVPLVRMRRDVARRALAQYTNRRARDVRGEVAAARMMYAALAEGTPVLLLSDVFGAACPRDDKLRPRLAIARADRAHVTFTHPLWENVYRFDTNGTRGPACRDGRVDVSSTRSRGWRVDDNGRSAPVGFALVPMVPPRIAAGHDLTRRFVLWEVEAWSDRRLDARPDIDPYLLQRLAPDCYAVVGQWDLTPVERAVMQGRTQPSNR